MYKNVSRIKKMNLIRSENKSITITEYFLLKLYLNTFKCVFCLTILTKDA